jgi:hypothetical protein
LESRRCLHATHSDLDALHAVLPGPRPARQRLSWQAEPEPDRGPRGRRSDLSYECKATLFDQEVRMAENIDFQFPMKKSCGADISRFCKDVQHGHAKTIRCLQDNLADPGMSAPCKAEVEKHVQHAAQDYRCAAPPPAPGFAACPLPAFLAGGDPGRAHGSQCSPYTVVYCFRCTHSLARSHSLCCLYTDCATAAFYAAKRSEQEPGAAPAQAQAPRWAATGRAPACRACAPDAYVILGRHTLP